MTSTGMGPFGAARLACPVCADALAVVDGALGCPAGHRFDVARQGYVSLLSGRGTAHRSDTAAMVAARMRVFGDGVYAPLVDAVAAAATRCGDGPDGVVVDGGGGAGDYLSAVLDARRAAGDHPVGVNVDLSKACARAAARAHPDAVSVVADLWAALPVQTSAARTVLSVFAPRNADETARILAPGGSWVIVTPEPGHLAEIVAPMGMLRVGEGKADRIAADLVGRFEVVDTRRVTAQRVLTPARLADVAGMGPAGFHRTTDELVEAADAVSGGGDTVVTLDVTVTVAARLPD